MVAVKTRPPLANNPSSVRTGPPSVNELSDSHYSFHVETRSFLRIGSDNVRPWSPRPRRESKHTARSTFSSTKMVTESTASQGLLPDYDSYFNATAASAAFKQQSPNPNKETEKVVMIPPSRHAICVICDFRNSNGAADCSMCGMNLAPIKKEKWQYTNKQLDSIEQMVDSKLQVPRRPGWQKPSHNSAQQATQQPPQSQHGREQRSPREKSRRRIPQRKRTRTAWQKPATAPGKAPKSNNSAFFELYPKTDGWAQIDKRINKYTGVERIWMQNNKTGFVEVFCQGAKQCASAATVAATAAAKAHQIADAAFVFFVKIRQLRSVRAVSLKLLYKMRRAKRNCVEMKLERIQHRTEELIDGRAPLVDCNITERKICLHEQIA